MLMRNIYIIHIYVYMKLRAETHFRICSLFLFTRAYKFQLYDIVAAKRQRCSACISRYVSSLSGCCFFCWSKNLSLDFDRSEFMYKWVLDETQKKTTSTHCQRKKSRKFIAVSSSVCTFVVIVRLFLTIF